MPGKHRVNPWECGPPDTCPIPRKRMPEMEHFSKEELGLQLGLTQGPRLARGGCSMGEGGGCGGWSVHRGPTWDLALTPTDPFLAFRAS